MYTSTNNPQIISLCNYKFTRLNAHSTNLPLNIQQQSLCQPYKSYQANILSRYAYLQAKLSVYSQRKKKSCQVLKHMLFSIGRVMLKSKPICLMHESDASHPGLLSRSFGRQGIVTRLSCSYAHFSNKLLLLQHTDLYFRSKIFWSVRYLVTYQSCYYLLKWKAIPGLCVIVILNIWIDRDYLVSYLSL